MLKGFHVFPHGVSCFPFFPFCPFPKNGDLAYTLTEGVPRRASLHRVQGSVDAAETPSEMMPQSHLAPFTSFSMYDGPYAFFLPDPDCGSPRHNTGTEEMTPREAGFHVSPRRVSCFPFYMHRCCNLDMCHVGVIPRFRPPVPLPEEATFLLGDRKLSLEW